MSQVVRGSVNTSGGGGGGTADSTVAQQMLQTAVLGATTDAVVAGDNDGSINARLRYIAKAIADFWDTVTHSVKVTIQNATLAVTQSGSWVLSAGAAVIGKVSIDQTTPGTTNLVALAANQSVNVAQVNGVTPLMGAGNTGTGSPRVTIATDQAALPITVASVPSHAVTNAGTFAVQPKGSSATNVAIADNPVNLGAQAVSSENAAVTTARQVQLVADLAGKLIVLPYANPENFVSGATASMTGTTTTSLLAQPASGLRNYITQITVSNAHATVGTDVIIQDGSGGTTLYTIPAAAVYGGAVIHFPAPLRQPTTATAIFCANVTTGASTKVSASGYKGI